ncbi:hypothetical protein C8R42DRAFT_724128 [Lentinula raphanica]|nr:hypothetical protein C8R42DRAFT_724128 [Lentinula raphanica]KAJ3819043.1 hypothetical protein F5880DRAFT_1616823 [Lentinula raphanica]
MSANATSKTTSSSKTGSRKRSRGNEVGNRRMKRPRRVEVEELSYEPGSWVIEKVFTGDSKIGEDVVRLFVVDQSGYVASPISSQSPETSTDQRHLSASLSVLSVNTRFVHRYRDGATLTTSRDGVDSTVAAERSSSSSNRGVIDSLGASKKTSLPQRGWACTAMNREKKTPRIQLCCCLPDEEALEEDALKGLDLEDVNGNEGDTELEDIDADLVYPDADASPLTKC